MYASLKFVNEIVKKPLRRLDQQSHLSTFKLFGIISESSRPEKKGLVEGENQAVENTNAGS